MLRIIQNSAAKGAKTYLTSSADYFAEGQELVGRWHGKGAARLGLSGTVERKDWDALCDNRNPATGGVLTPRQKQNRRVGYDFNFHVPKSVSILYSLTRDERILDAFRDSVNTTMEDMEAEMQTRVRTKGRDEDRTTGHMVVGEFLHFTARPIDGIPDPHLHAHCFVFNTTWDEQESRWKAGQFAGLKRDAPYFEAMFHSRLARGLAELGLSIERKKRGWEIAGVPDSAIRKFSRRTALIEAKAKEDGITDANAKAELGAKTRERKRKDLSLDELREEWRSRLTADEESALAGVTARLGHDRIPENELAAREAAALAIWHCFERNSVVPERTLLAETMKRSVGAATPESVGRCVDGQNLIVAEREGRRLVTTREVLAGERRMLDFARRGRGSCRPLAGSNHVFKRDWLNEGQRNAVRHVLASRDHVMIVRGKAGTGKTSMMQETVEGIEASGHRVYTFAPSADASRGVLRKEGFANADTVARLLLDERLQESARGHVLWIDEAGLLSARTTAQVFDLADRIDARVVLSGDRKQHGSVERGAALRLLEEEAGLVSAELREIQRQRGDYKAIVHSLSEGRIAAGFKEMDRLGWIREIGDADRYKVIAEDYVAALAQGKSALAIAPTHREGQWVSDEIRARLKQCGRLGKDERQFLTLENANLTEAERADPASYSPADVLVYHQNARGRVKGDRVEAGAGPVPIDQASRFQVYRPGTLSLAPGDVVRITRNGKTVDGGEHRLNNGSLHAVKGFDGKGDIVLANGWKISKDFGFLSGGYVVTSHASQGKTVDRVFIAQSAISYPASSRQQAYVSISRAREKATIFCDDRHALLEAVSRSDDRLTATDLVSHAQARNRAATLHRHRSLEMEPARADEQQKEAARGT